MRSMVTSIGFEASGLQPSSTHLSSPCKLVPYLLPVVKVTEYNNTYIIGMMMAFSQHLLLPLKFCLCSPNTLLKKNQVKILKHDIVRASRTTAKGPVLSRNLFRGATLIEEKKNGFDLK